MEIHNGCSPRDGKPLQMLLMTIHSLSKDRTIHICPNLLLWNLCNLGNSLLDDIVESPDIDLARVGHHLGGDVGVVEYEEHHQQNRRRRREQADRHAPHIGEVPHLGSYSLVSVDNNAQLSVQKKVVP